SCPSNSSEAGITTRRMIMADGTGRGSLHAPRPKVRARQVPMNGMRGRAGPQNAGVNLRNGTPATAVVAVQAAPVREALSAVLGTLDGIEVVAEAATDEQALELARQTRPQLAVIDQELSGCAGCWLMGELQRERLVEAIVAVGLRGNGLPAH